MNRVTVGVKIEQSTQDLERIKVVIHQHELQDIPLPLRGLHVGNVLRKAGVPVSGLFATTGVTSGILKNEQDPCTLDIIYQWEKNYK
jgi:hypothetical protein